METEALKQQAQPKAESPWKSIDLDTRARLLVEAAKKPVRAMLQLDWYSGGSVEVVESLELRSCDTFRFYIPMGRDPIEALSALEAMLGMVKLDPRVSEMLASPRNQQLDANVFEILDATADLVLKKAKELRGVPFIF